MKHLTMVPLLASLATAQTPRCYDMAPVDRFMTTTIDRLRLRGASLILEKDNAILYRKAFRYDANRVVPIASATKWVSGILVMSQIDDGKIRLDDPLSKYFGQLQGDMAKATIRQCMSHTAGFDGQLPAVGNRSLTLAQAAAEIFKTPLRYKPGTSFHYGGASMHLVGRVLEIATGKDLEVLLKERILTPMGIRTIDYQGLGATKNYRFAGGMRASLDDYATVLRMVANRGMHGNRRILSEASIAEMLRDQTNGAVIRHTPQPDNRRYGIGCWRDRIDANGKILQASSQGAFGFSPWIDFERNVAGTFLVVNLINRIASAVDTLQAWTRQTFDPAGVLCYGRATTSCRGTVAATANEIPRSGATSFALESRMAAPNTGGALLVSGQAFATGVPIFGAELWVRLGGSISLPTVTTASGNSRVPLPLVGVARDTRFFAQFVWLETATCGNLGRLDASWALDLRVQ